MPSTTLTLSSGVSYAPYGTLTVTETGTSATANVSYCDAVLTLHRPYSISSSATKSASMTIDGTTYSWSGTIGGQGDLVLISRSITIPHGDDGKKTINLSASITLDINWGGTQIGTIQNSGSLKLTDISLRPSVTQTLTSKTETSITMSWESNKTIDRVWYSTNGGSSWSSPISANAKKGSYTITGLTPGSTYSIVTSLRALDTQLYTNSDPMSVKCYWYPYANAMPDFAIGDRVTIGIYNPLGRTYSVTITFADGTTHTLGQTYSGTSVSGFRDSSWIPRWYNSIPRSKSGTYKVTVTYDSHSDTEDGGTYTIKEADCKPSIGTLGYQDTNTTTQALIQDNQKIVQKLGIVRYTASGLATQYGATVSKVEVKVNNTNYTLSVSGSSATGGNATIDSSTNVTATATITDSRGVTATKTVTVQMLAWENPSAIVNVQRVANYYTETNLYVDPTFSSMGGKNSVSVAYRYKQVGTSTWTAWTTMTGTTATFQADNNQRWDVQVRVTDAFGATTTINATLGKGIPLMFYDALRSAVGINCFPQTDESLWLNGEEIKPSEMLRWDDLDQFGHLYPDEVHYTGLGNSQGMACDGTNIYLTNRGSVANTTPMKVTKMSLSDYTVAGTHTLTSGHYNSLYYYGGKLYASGAAVSTGNNVDYTKVAVIDASTFAETIKTMPNNWGVGIRDFGTRGTVTAFYIPSTRNISYYAAYNSGSESYQVPLTEVTLDYTGCTTVQGSFHMTNEYLWVLESAYNEATLASGHQVVRCFSYSGALIRSFYLEETNNEELEDLWVSDDNKTLVINDAKGNIYKYTLPTLYRTLSSSIAETGALKVGQYKHVYTMSSPLDTKKTYTRSGSTYTAYSVAVLSDYTFASEIGYFETPMLRINGGLWAGNLTAPLGTISFSGSYEWAGGGVMSWRFEFTRRTSTNYEYYLSRASVRIRDSSTNKEYSETSTDGDLSDTSSGIGKMFNDLYSAGWMFGDFGIDSLTYIVGVPRSSTSLGLI